MKKSIDNEYICRKQITFDIDTVVTKQIIGSSYNNIYDKINKFLMDNDFEHIEGSVYVSRFSITNTDIKLLLIELLEKYPYLDKCIRDIRQTDVMSVHSLNKYFHYDGTPGIYVNHKIEDKTEEIYVNIKSR